MTELAALTVDKVDENMSEDEIMSQMPEDLGQLKKFVEDKISDKWESVAIQLGFTIAETQAIKANHAERPVVQCCKDLLFGWVGSTKSDNPANDLVAAIRAVGYGYQADLFEEEMKNKKDIVEPGYLETKVIPEISIKWYGIGLELKIPAGKLEGIKNERDHCGAQCFTMLQRWFNRGKSVAEESKRPIWKNIYDAMCAVDLNFRAQKLKELILETYNYHDIK